MRIAGRIEFESCAFLLYHHHIKLSKFQESFVLTSLLIMTFSHLKLYLPSNSTLCFRKSRKRTYKNTATCMCKCVLFGKGSPIAYIMRGESERGKTLIKQNIH